MMSKFLRDRRLTPGDRISLCHNFIDLLRFWLIKAVSGLIDPNAAVSALTLKRLCFSGSDLC
jgi:hypothetical protein